MIRLIVGNLWRHRLIFGLVGLLIVLLSLYLSVALSVAFSVSKSLGSAVRDNLTGDAVIMDARVESVEMISPDSARRIELLREPQALLEFVQGHDDVQLASTRLGASAFLRSANNVAPFMLIGQSVERGAALLPHRHLTSGQAPHSEDDIALYYRHADMLSANLSETLNATIKTSDGSERDAPLRLTGLYDYEDLAFYTEFVFAGFMDIDQLRRLQGLAPDATSELHLRLKPGRGLGPLQRDLHTRFSDGYKLVEPQDASALVQGIHALTFVTVGGGGGARGRARLSVVEFPD